jgi:hypothetical protein
VAGEWMLAERHPGERIARVPSSLR